MVGQNKYMYSSYLVYTPKGTGLYGKVAMESLLNQQRFGASFSCSKKTSPKQQRTDT